MTGEDGARRETLPAPGAEDDPERAPAAHRRFTALRKDVRTVASAQIQRLEAAMVTGRRWAAPEFRRLLVEHPLIRHITRRLVWLAEHDGAVTAFRVAEDRTYADVGDDALTLPAEARIGLAHPVELGGDLDAWTALFADYAILQPFPQLGRVVHALSDAERAGARLDRFEGAAVAARAVLGLERRGWRRAAPMDAGIQGAIHRAAPGGLHVNVRLDPGVPVGRVDEGGDQRLAEIRLDDRPEDGRWSPGRAGRPFGDLDPVTASEVLADLAAATS
ncbi:DUF4132 domain-containing protein [Actinomadura litoris]|uniref:DUF4132 domain-containing protein n=1 Tax=Actinomadura litoris TaxID=2678616 RepID=UPI001FA74EB1|nr:DUF4132 domain-containing protein [Actinomadura litoris]